MAASKSKDDVVKVETVPMAEVPPGVTMLEDAPDVLGGGEVQDATDKAEEKGYIGTKVDPRPNSDYSLEGGAPGTEND